MISLTLEQGFEFVSVAIWWKRKVEVAEILNALNPLRPGRTWIVYHPRRQRLLTLSPVLKTHVRTDVLSKRVSVLVRFSPCRNRDPLASIWAGECDLLTAVRVVRGRATREPEKRSAE